MARKSGNSEISAAKRQFEISGTDLKPRAETLAATAFPLRGEWVMLASEVALIFEVGTREIVQNIKNNPDIFPDRYAFELARGEVESLRSAGLIPKPGRGGSRALPWAVTRKGTLRLATIMKSPRAIEATDIFIDIFDEVLRQVQAGRGQVTIETPSTLIETDADRELIHTVRTQLSDAVTRLLDTVVEPGGEVTVADELREVSGGAISHVKAWLNGKSVSNEKIEAETVLIIEQAQDMYERRQADLAEQALDRERKALENLRLGIDAVRELVSLYRELEPSALVDLTRRFAPSQKTSPHDVPIPAVPPPAKRND